MPRNTTPFASRLALCLLALALPACSSSPTAEPAEVPDFEGTYSLTGTYYGRTDSGIEGTLEITGQSGTTATASVSVKVLDHGNTSFALNTPSDVTVATAPPGQAQLGSDGSFSLAFSGREEIFGIDPADCCAFTFSFEGKLSAGSILGTWTLTRDMPSLDKGSFTALR
ncbi:MAG TPA: hypothetical protein VK849_10680 [Longimicrobiales bacterium]|nr:hypothetical protein [Longimicrobiales bacterium]